MNSVDLKKLAKEIKSRKYPTVKVPLDEWFDVDPQGGISPIREKRVQVRSKDRCIDRVMRGVNKMEETGDISGADPLTIIEYEDGTRKICNGNHTCEMLYRLGEKEADACIVKEKQLDYSYAKSLTLGNLLNVEEIEKVDVHDADIKKELYEILNEALLESETKDKIDESKLDEIKNDVSGRYPHVTKATIGQWISNHGVVGGRSTSTLISYTDGELENIKITLTNLEENATSIVLSPRVLRSWNETGISEAIRQMAKENKHSVVVLLYIDNSCWKDKWENTDLEDRIKEEYQMLSEFYEVTFKYQMLRYQIKPTIKSPSSGNIFTIT